MQVATGRCSYLCRRAAANVSSSVRPEPPEALWSCIVVAAAGGACCSIEPRICRAPLPPSRRRARRQGRRASRGLAAEFGSVRHAPTSGATAASRYWTSSVARRRCEVFAASAGAELHFNCCSYTATARVGRARRRCADALSSLLFVRGGRSRARRRPLYSRNFPCQERSWCTGALCQGICE